MSTTFELDLTTFVYGGDAMGRLPDGRAVFVPYGMPDERVRVRLVEEKRNFARAELLEVLRPSPDRIQPPFEHLAECGGCAYAHVRYPAQLRAKESVLRDQLQRIAGIAAPPVDSIVPSPQEWHYRNAAQFHISPEGRLGFEVPGTNTVVPVASCALCEPAINDILPQLDFEAVPGLDRIQVRAGSGGEILLVFESDDINPPELMMDTDASAVFLGPEDLPPIVMAGDDHIIIEALEHPFRVSAGSFFQVNTSQAENMVRYVLENLPLTAQSQVLEVYAGVGLFSAFLAPRVAHLTANESALTAVDDFAVNLDAFDNVDLYTGLAEDVLPGLRFRPEVVLVDPPRAGLALPALDAVVGMQPRFLAYVSCDPSTLARDAKRLLAAGYTLERVRPFDMFPQTYHIESVSFFTR